MDGGSADHAGAVICRHAGDRRKIRKRLSPVRRAPCMSAVFSDLLAEKTGDVERLTGSKGR